VRTPNPIPRFQARLGVHGGFTASGAKGGEGDRTWAPGNATGPIVADRNPGKRKRVRRRGRKHKRADAWEVGGGVPGSERGIQCDGKCNFEEKIEADRLRSAVKEN